MQTAISNKAQVLIVRQLLIESELSKMETILTNAERGPMGLVAEHAKTIEWRAAKSAHASLWNDYRQINMLLAKMRKAIGYKAVNGKRVAIYQYK
jgi:hypothetical protein